MNRKAVVLISGGLDSTLAAKLMLQQGVELVGLYLSAPWGCCDKTKAMKVAGQLGIPFMVMKLTNEYINVIRRPKYGYGSSMNPCIDCRIYMFHKAKELMRQVDASFLVTGEVLGQRPMSQMPRSLHLIEQDSGLSRLIVRPLSAKVLPTTLAEESGAVDREKLYGITGRSRKPQMELARQLGVLDYPNPAGGCLLTDKQFGDRVRDLFEHQEEIDLEDMELLRLGRHFRVNPSTKLIVGRNEEENRVLEEYLAAGRLLVAPDDFSGPTALVVGAPDDEAKSLAVQAIAHYTRPEKCPPSAMVLCKMGLSRDSQQQPLTETLPLTGGLAADVLERMRI